MHSRPVKRRRVLCSDVWESAAAVEFLPGNYRFAFVLVNPSCEFDLITQGTAFMSNAVAAYKHLRGPTCEASPPFLQPPSLRTKSRSHNQLLHLARDPVAICGGECWGVWLIFTPR